MCAHAVTWHQIFLDVAPSESYTRLQRFSHPPITISKPLASARLCSMQCGPTLWAGRPKDQRESQDCPEKPIRGPARDTLLNSLRCSAARAALRFPARPSTASPSHWHPAAARPAGPLSERANLTDIQNLSAAGQCPRRRCRVLPQSDSECPGPGEWPWSGECEPARLSPSHWHDSDMTCRN
jgi:hypothetical protein